MILAKAEIFDDHHGETPTIIMGQLPMDQWCQSIGDNTLADAILDRFILKKSVQFKVIIYTT